MSHNTSSVFSTLYFNNLVSFNKFNVLFLVIAGAEAAQLSHLLSKYYLSNANSEEMDLQAYRLHSGGQFIYILFSRYTHYVAKSVCAQQYNMTAIWDFSVRVITTH